jgi:hypothetical protein
MAAVAIAAAGAGCMLDPGDGAIHATTDVISIAGGVFQPSTSVQVVAFQPGTTTSLPIANPTSPAEATWSFHGTDVYGWNTSIVIPAWAWGSGTSGQVARLQSSLPDGTTMPSFTSRWEACLAAQDYDFGRFFWNCRGPHSPDEFIYTSDYPTSVDLELRDITRGADGRLRVTVHDGGRHGIVTLITCHVYGAADGGVTASFHDVLFPLQSNMYSVDLPAFPADVSVNCVVSGTNEDGSPEPAALLGNNTLTSFVH